MTETKNTRPTLRDLLKDDATHERRNDPPKVGATDRLARIMQGAKDENLRITASAKFNTGALENHFFWVPGFKQLRNL